MDAGSSEVEASLSEMDAGSLEGGAGERNASTAIASPPQWAKGSSRQATNADGPPARSWAWNPPEVRTKGSPASPGDVATIAAALTDIGDASCAGTESNLDADGGSAWGTSSVPEGWRATVGAADSMFGAAENSAVAGMGHPIGR